MNSKYIYIESIRSTDIEILFLESQQNHELFKDLYLLIHTVCTVSPRFYAISIREPRA